MKKYFLLWLLIIIQLIGCKKREANIASLYINNKSTDTIHVQYYAFAQNVKDVYLVEKNLVPDSNYLLIVSDFFGTPNELVQKKIKYMQLYFKDTSYLISGKTDTLNNLFINNRWIFTKTDKNVIRTMFKATILNDYKFVFNIY